MNRKTAILTKNQKHESQLHRLLYYVDQLTEHKFNVDPKGTVLEIGAQPFLSDRYLEAGIHFNNISTGTVDVICDEAHLPFSANYDCVISPLSLHFTKSPKTHLKQLISILKPGGQLILTTFGHYSLHEIRSSAPENTNFELLDFIHPSQLKSWLPYQGERAITEDWIYLSYDSLFDFFHELKDLKLKSLSRANEQLSIQHAKKNIKNFEGRLTFQLITLIYKKPHLLRDE